MLCGTLRPHTALKTLQQLSPFVGRCVHYKLNGLLLAVAMHQGGWLEPILTHGVLVAGGSEAPVLRLVLILELGL